MRYRSLVTGLLVAAVVMSEVASMPMAGQAPGQDQTDYTSPRTPWGDPDLQGTWNNITGVPLERPAELSGKEFFTQEEAVQFAEQAHLPAAAPAAASA